MDDRAGPLGEDIARYSYRANAFTLASRPPTESLGVMCRDVVRVRSPMSYRYPLGRLGLGAVLPRPLIF